MKSIEDIKIDTLKSNEYYNKVLDEVKEIIKAKILNMNTKDEQLQYVLQEKTRYALLKNNNKGYSLIALILGIGGLVSTILLTMLKDNMVFFILWLIALVVLFGAIGTYSILSISGSNVKYSVILMAYEDIEQKLKNGSINGHDNEEMQLKYMIENIRESIDVIQGQLKMIYALQSEQKSKRKSRTAS